MSRTATPKDLIPDAHCVLGTMLRPFSLGHHLLLAKVESPFTSRPTAEGLPDELALAVFICARPYTEAHEALVRGDWEKEFSAWLKRLKPSWYQPNRFEHSSELAKFNAYLSAGYQKPPVWRHELPSTIEFTAPDECLVKCKLVMSGFNEATVLNQYLPHTWYDYFTVQELIQAEEITNPTKWRTVFYTEEHDAKLHPQDN